jgi:hypothetical protein
MTQEITIKISIGPGEAIVSKGTVAAAEAKVSLPPPPQEPETITMAEMIVPSPPEVFEEGAVAGVFISPPPAGIEGFATNEVPVPPVPEI